MNITELLDRPIAYHRVFVTLTGSVKAAILLSQAVYWQKRAKQKDGWWYKTTEEWEEETGLTRREQETARRDCEKYLQTDLRDSPARLYWKVDEETLSKDLLQFGGKRQTEIGENRQTSLHDSAKPVSTKTPNIKRNAETTTEITTEINDEALAQISKAYEAEIGVITAMIADDLRDASVTYPLKWILDAIHEAAVNNKRGWNYCLAILKRWHAQGNQEPAKKNGAKHANTNQTPNNPRDPEQDERDRETAAIILAQRAARAHVP